MPRSPHSRRFVREKAQELVTRVEAGHPGSITSLGEDALGAVAAWPGLQLHMTPEREISGGCSVSGSYDYRTGNIVVGESLSRARRRFTALHEFGHFFQQHDETSVQLLLEEEDEGRALEDDICDAFAAEVLLPDAIVDEVFGSEGATAFNIVDLMRTSDASREACCVRSVQRLPGRGYVMLCDLAGTAIFTAQTTGYPVRRNTGQAGNEVVQSTIRWRSARQLSRVQFPSGGLSPKYFADATVDGEYVVAAFVEHMAPWDKGPHFPIPEPNHAIAPPFGGTDRTTR